MTRDGLRLFYIPPAAVQGERVILGAEESAHIRRVLKMKVGAICRAATSEGQEYKIELTEITASESTARIIERLPKRPSSPLSIALGLPLLKGERFEWVLQKGCELGADAFYPLACSSGAKSGFRKKGASSATGGGGELSWKPPSSAIACPRLLLIHSGDLESFLAETKDFDLKLMGYLGEHAMSAKEALSRVGRDATDAPLRAALLTGPEGDLTEEESGQALDSGFLPVSLGPRILRADTAPVSLLTIVQHALGDMG